MYTFEVDGKLYAAQVSYSEEASLYPVKVSHVTPDTPEAHESKTTMKVHVPVRVTAVDLGEVIGFDGDGKPEVDVFATGTAFCHPNDNFVKAIGRHVAAMEAVKFAYMTASVPQNENFAKAVLKLFPKV